MAGAFSIENDVERVKRRGFATDEFLAELAALNGISGASQSRISQALRGSRPFTTQEHEPLRTLVLNLECFLDAHAPLPIMLRDSELISRLMNEHLASKKDMLIHSVYIVEFADDRSLFQGIVDGVVRRTLNSATAAPLKNRDIAVAVVNALNKLGYRARAHSVRMRTSEAQIATSLQQLGFTQ